ncbi:uncharacterized protein LOC119838114 [Zerene cesonia]|uniref:uncharacterized protein LOC119838114 n=1 Tax=Zerene cesonia TaxID=33412 RepID=UPI0018E54793|nr:uncharacterized protein LOC119838114 [Zerene cesonia]
MADSFFGFDTSSSNLNDDDCAEPSEEEYDALNNETFGQDSDDFDWEVEHEHLAEQLESSRRQNAMDEADSRLEASLSQLVLDENEPQPRASLSSNVWRHDFFPPPPAPVPQLKNVCTVEELERQLRQNQPPQNYNQSYFQPRFPVILQRPPGLQAPVSLPFAPQQQMAHNMNQMNQPVNKIIGQNQMVQNHLQQNMGQMNQNMNQMAQMNQYMQNNQMNQFQNNQMGQGMMQMNQMGQNMHQMNQNQLFQNQLNQNQLPQNQMGQNVNQMGQNMNQMGQNMNQMGQNMNQMGQSVNQMSQNVNQMAQNVNQMGQNVNPIGQNVNQMNQNMNQMGQNMNPMGQTGNQMGQNMNQMGQNVNQIMPNGNFAQNQYQHMGMGQPRMMAPPPGMGMPRQNFNQGVNQYNPNFRPTIPTKNEPINAPMNHAKNQPTNQVKTSQPNPTTSPVKKRTEPKIKSRVYSNSQSKPLTSQNLVQMIQNTHPMLVYNSYYNASHHPMLARNFNNQIVHPMLSGQRNGGFGNAVSRNSNDDSSTASESDDYAGLMTQREKQWLINIQMLQLNTGTPYIHDFYYTVFLERQANKEKAGIKEAHKANQQNHPFYSGGVKQEDRHARERHNSHRHNSTSEDPPRTYVPTQFENSLGKLQCGSVTAPRKIIDVEVVGSEPPASRLSRAPSVASTTHPAEVPREMRRTKQLLLDIEALYLILLRLEELNDPLAISNALILKEREEKQKQLEAAQKEAESQEDESNVFLKNIESVQRRPKQDSPKSDCVDKRQVVNLAINQKPVPVKNLLDEDKDDLVNKMFAGLLYGDRLPQMLSVRKGRALVCRFLRRAAHAHPHARALWARLLRALAAARRDLALHALAPHYRKYIQNSTGWTAVLESCSILSEALDPARTPYALTNGLTLSCVCALAEKAMVLSNTPEATSSERQWFKFLKTVARSLKNTSLNVARPAAPLPEAKLLHHIRQLESRSTIEILQRGKRASDIADLAKGELADLLVKYLC